MAEQAQGAGRGPGYSVITINRQYGALGRTLASILSDRLGIKYYDKDFVLKTAEESGYDVDIVRREGEELSRSGQFLDNFLNSTVSYKSSHDEIFRAEKEVILKLAESPCIIVGRCANHVLKEAGIPALSVYLTASLERRMARAKELAENGDTPLDKYVEAREKMRRIFYKQYTGRDMEDASNYTLCFDVGHIDLTICADIMEKLYRESRA